MLFIHSKTTDLDSIMDIIHDAQSFLASLEIDQWQNGYPNQAAILNDIKNDESFIVKKSEGQVAGTAMFTTNPEPTYLNILGNWLTPSNQNYGVIHRMAVSNAGRNKGIAKFIFKECEQQLVNRQITSMRIDTHEDNMGMQALLKKLGYTYCGVIYLQNGDKRLAYEKILLKDMLHG